MKINVPQGFILGPLLILFYLMLICTRRISISHIAFDPSYVPENLGLDTKIAFLWQLDGKLLAQNGFWRPSWIVKFPPGGLFGTFSM